MSTEPRRNLVPDPLPEAANDLWRYLVIGLLVLLLVALVGVVYLLADGDPKSSPDVALTAFTGLLTGLLGLFIKTPTK